MSTCVASIKYDEATETLVISFVRGGGSHTYHDVPAKVVADLQTAGSQGGYFNAHIRDAF